MKNITLNEKQRLYVIPCGDGFTCFGFDNCYRDAVAMAERMNALKSVNNGAEYVAPTPDMVGTIECYEAYQDLSGHYAKHPVSKRTWYTPGTPKPVIRILEDAMKDKTTVLRIFYGDHETGRDWVEENDTVGFIGRSNGSMKVPLLLEPLRDSYGDLRQASGGGALLDHCIVRVINWSTGEEVYRSKNYQLPAYAIAEATADLKAKGYTATALRDGKCNANFKSHEDALEYVAFMQGFRIARPFRTRAEYNDELRQAA